MRPANLAALALCIVALGLFLLGSIFAVAPLLKDPTEILEESSVLDRAQKQITRDGMESFSPWTFPLMNFLFLAFPATVVAAMGIGSWYFVGRRQDEALERKIALWRSEGPGLGESAAGVNGFPGRPPVKTHPKLVAVVVSLLALAGLFVILWGLTSLVLLGTWEEARQHASQRAGTEIDAAAMTVGGLTFLSIALLPLAAALGIWWLHRRDVRLQERWRRATRSRTSSAMIPPRVSRSQADW